MFYAYCKYSENMFQFQLYVGHWLLIQEQPSCEVIDQVLAVKRSALLRKKKYMINLNVFCNLLQNYIILQYIYIYTWFLNPKLVGIWVWSMRQNSSHGPWFPWMFIGRFTTVCFTYVQIQECSFGG